MRSKGSRHSRNRVGGRSMGFSRHALVAALVPLFFSSCGIEVGNPHPKPGTGSGGTGALTLALADSPVDDAKHVYFNITGIRVVPETGSGDVANPLPVTLMNGGKVDALTLRDGNTLALSTAQTLPLGSYAGVILDLDSTTPARSVVVRSWPAARSRLIWRPRTRRGRSSSVCTPRTCPLNWVAADARRCSRS